MPLPCALVDSTGFGAGMANVPQGGLQTARAAELGLKTAASF
jgi:hypothetical protein